MNLKELADTIEKVAGSSDLEPIIHYLKTLQEQTLQEQTLPEQLSNAGVCRSRQASRFADEFCKQYESTRSILESEIPKWEADQTSFWGPYSSGLESNIPLVPQVYKWMNNDESNEIISLIRRRISRAAFTEIRNKVQYRVEERKLKIGRGITWRALANQIILENVLVLAGEETGKEIESERLTRRLREGEKYASLPTGMCIALGKMGTTYLSV